MYLTETLSTQWCEKHLDKTFGFISFYYLSFLIAIDRVVSDHNGVDQKVDL